MVSMVVLLCEGGDHANICTYVREHGDHVMPR